MLLDRSGKVKGLTASVLDGVLHAKTPFVVVMDADLQHPPAVIKSIVEQLRNGSQIVVGTRTDKPADWGFFRFLASNTAILLGRIRLRISGAYASDLVSGFSVRVLICLNNRLRIVLIVLFLKVTKFV